MKIMMCSIYVLCVSVVVLYDIAVAHRHSHGPMIIKSINTTTIIGESILFDCAQHTEFDGITDLVKFNWTLNGKPMKQNNRILLGNNNKSINITDITVHDKGKYECFISIQPEMYYSVFFLNVTDLNNQMIHKVSTVKYTNHVDGSLYWTCNTFNGDSSNNNEYTWFKNKKPLHLDINGRLSLENNNMSLRITNITTGDRGTYECFASNQIHKYSTVFMFNVVYQPHEHIRVQEMYDENTSRYINESVSWNCSITGNHQKVNKYKYTWFKNGVPIHLSKNDQRRSLIMGNSILKIIKLNHEDSGNYFCNASNGLVTGFYNRTLTVVDLPKGDIYAWYSSNLKLITNATVQLRCKTLHSSRKYKTSFKWLKNNKPLILFENVKVTSLTNNNQTLVLQAIKGGQNITYTCEASNIYHKFYSTYTYNIIDSEKLQFYNESHKITMVHPGESVEWWCYVRGMPPPQINWYKNGFPFHVPENDKSRILLRESNQNLLINSTNIKDIGNYECRAINRIGDLCAITFKLDLNGTDPDSTKNDRFFTSNASYIFYGVVIGILTLCVLVDFIRKRKRRAMLKESLLLSSRASNTDINNVDLK